MLGFFVSLSFLLFSWLLLLLSNRLFLVWVALEIKMFSIIPLLLISNSGGIRAISYFFFQALGTICFLWGGWFFVKVSLVEIGLCIKMGLVPLGFWFPFLVSSLGWDTIFILTTLKKLPLLYFFNILSPSHRLLFFCLLRLFLSLAFACGGGFRKVKLSLGWISVLESAVLVFLFSQRVGGGWVYLFSYSLIFRVLCVLLFFSDREKKRLLGVGGGLCLLLLTGFPPFFRFVCKTQFLQVLLLKKSFILRLGFLVLFWFQALFYLRVSLGFFSRVKTWRNFPFWGFLLRVLLSLNLLLFFL